MATKSLKLTDLDKKEAKSRAKEALMWTIAGIALLLTYTGFAGCALVYHVVCGG